MEINANKLIKSTRYFMAPSFFKRQFLRFCSDRFFGNSLIFFIGSFVVSLGNYFFHFVIARTLSLEGYGEIQSLIAILTIFSLPLTAISLVLIRYTALLSAKRALEKLSAFFYLLIFRTLVLAGIFSLIFLSLNSKISQFLYLENRLALTILGLGLLPAFLNTVNRAIIQGLERFKILSLIGTGEAVLKIFFTFWFLRLGWNVNGVMGAIVLSSFGGYLMTLLPLRPLIKNKNPQKEKGFKTREVLQYGFPVVFNLLFLSFLSSGDMILVKHFMSKQIAGEYGALALIGRTVVFLVTPISSVMFSIIATDSAKKIDSSGVLKKSLFFTALVAWGIISAYFLFPEFIIKIMVGEKFLAVERFLGWFGLGMFFFSLVNVLAQYFLCSGQTKPVFILGIGSLIQMTAICLWHKHLVQIITIINGTMFLMFILFLIYYRYFRLSYRGKNGFGLPGSSSWAF